MNFLKILIFTIKKKLYKRVGQDVSQDRVIQVTGYPVEVGRFTYGIEHASVLSWGDKNKISIGRFCSVSFGLKLYIGGNHRTDWLSTFPFGHIFTDYINVSPVVGHPASKGEITIGNDVWIGRDVTVLSGVDIGDGAVVAANSTVVSNVLPYTIVGGNPAKLIKDRFAAETVKRLSVLKWWNYPVDVVTEIVPYLCSQNDEIIDSNLSHIEKKVAEYAAEDNK